MTATPTPFPAVAPIIAKPSVEAAAEVIAVPVGANVAARRIRTTQLLARQGRHHYALVVTVVGIAVMALLAFLLQAKSSPTSTPPRQDVQETPPAPPSNPAPAPPPAITEPRTTVMLQVTTEPSGATVVLDGVRLGVTPFSAPVAIKSDADAWLKVRMHGYAAVKTRVSLDQDVRWDVRLRQLRGTPKP
jgi:hypothetical protein